MESTLSDRIKTVVKASKLNQTQFAAKVSISQQFLSQICNGRKTPSDRTITDICREFNVNEIWLRTGEGEPFQQESRQEEIMKFAAQTIKGSDEFRKQFVSMLAKMTADDWVALGALFSKYAEESKK